MCFDNSLVISCFGLPTSCQYMRQCTTAEKEWVLRSSVPVLSLSARLVTYFFKLQVLHLIIGVMIPNSVIAVRSKIILNIEMLYIAGCLLLASCVTLCKLLTLHFFIRKMRIIVLPLSLSCGEDCISKSM